MPDHIHLLLLGYRRDSDLNSAARFIRSHTSSAIQHALYQKQSYDNVLSKEDRGKEALAALARYIGENPVRAGLCDKADVYPFSGAVVPGYPSVDIHSPDYWPLFWKVFTGLSNAAP